MTILAAGLLAVSPAAAAPERPVLAGRTVLTANGIAGVSVEVPPKASLPRENVVLTLEGGSFAFVGLVPETCEPSFYSDVCLEHEFYAQPESGFPTWIMAPTPPRLLAGRYDVYVVSDGQVEVVMTVKGLAGETHIEATGRIDAMFSRLPARCPQALPSCQNVGYGGEAHSVGEKGFALGLAWARVPPHIPGTPLPNLVGASAAVEGCAYPNPEEPDVSADPSDHPYGCVYVPTSDNVLGPLDKTLGLTLRAAQLATGWRKQLGTERASGDVYLGYTAEQFSMLVPGGSYGAHGVWVTLGIEDEEQP